MSQTLTQDVTRAARLFHALADETRLQIVEFLSRGEQCVCDLTDALETGQSRLSFHLKILKEAGLIRDRREGRWNYYSLAPEAFEEVAKLVGAMKDGTKLFTKPSRCCG
ncbi:MAG TPA: metalloregulator ArsR/SmtB family transcription factor [Nitrospiraceae bacterium]|jgi:ArsR family transcriptional regulator|nr:metalloregulator ArsR/SmtB family transcription factor [Nitrospiraceae bacterium]